MSIQVQRRRGSAASVASFTGAAGELAVDTTNNRLVVQDGSTAGGFPAAKLSEAVLNNVATNTLAAGAAGSLTKMSIVEELVTLSTGSATTTASTQISAGALVMAVGSRVVTTIGTATAFEVGVSGSLSLFGSSLGVSSGSTNEGLISPNPYYSGTNILITCNTTPSSGVVRLSIHYMTFSPPSS